jgi:carbonic anhydrase
MNGGTDWGFGICTTGTAQSPINIISEETTHMKGYITATWSLVNFDNFRAEWIEHTYKIGRKDHLKFGTLNVKLPGSNSPIDFDCTDIVIKAPSEHGLDSE